ncbi:unnamed protein product [Heligmosomoides polygyrus]|uniref:Reverse transcriptase domain-containing protein n=1 Tax=Heligmosomoides polygyrus TaxID=6339 RepID=A0A183F774_HELPZ|nr:unnamed protein product [Heligmosomoides polygyrus]
MKIVVAAKEQLYHLFSAYAPQTGCSDQAKDEFWSLLDEKAAKVPSKDVIIVAGDLNGHVGTTKDGYIRHGGFGYGSRNADDFVLVKDRNRSLATDAKIVPYETVAPEHRLLNCTLKIPLQGRSKSSDVVHRESSVTIIDETWKKVADAIRQAARLELGITVPGRRKVEKQTWLWTDDVKVKVREVKSLHHVFLSDKTADNWRNNQCGFVAGCGTVDAIRLLTEKHREKQKPVPIVFLDLEKAFDRVKWYGTSELTLYGAECWPATKEVEMRFSLMETMMLRWTAGVTRMDRIRNDAIQQKFGVAPIADKMREARLRWYGHVLRGK